MVSSDQPVGATILKRLRFESLQAFGQENWYVHVMRVVAMPIGAAVMSSVFPCIRSRSPAAVGARPRQGTFFPASAASNRSTACTPKAHRQHGVQQSELVPEGEAERPLRVGA
eukprot:5312043-Pyramimonas_sp.AAC.1